MAEYVLSELVAAMQPEGSELRIRKAGPDNLNWTFWAEYTNGTGDSVSCTAESLELALVHILTVLWQARQGTS